MSLLKLKLGLATFLLLFSFALECKAQVKVLSPYEIGTSAILTNFGSSAKLAELQVLSSSHEEYESIRIIRHPQYRDYISFWKCWVSPFTLDKAKRSEEKAPCIPLRYISGHVHPLKFDNLKNKDGQFKLAWFNMKELSLLDQSITDIHAQISERQGWLVFTAGFLSSLALELMILEAFTIAGEAAMVYRAGHILILGLNSRQWSLLGMKVFFDFYSAYTAGVISSKIYQTQAGTKMTEQNGDLELRAPIIPFYGEDATVNDFVRQLNKAIGPGQQMGSRLTTRVGQNKDGFLTILSTLHRDEHDLLDVRTTGRFDRKTSEKPPAQAHDESALKRLQSIYNKTQRAAMYEKKNADILKQLDGRVLDLKDPVEKQSQSLGMDMIVDLNNFESDLIQMHGHYTVKLKNKKGVPDFRSRLHKYLLMSNEVKKDLYERDPNFGSVIKLVEKGCAKCHMGSDTTRWTSWPLMPTP